MSQPQSQLQSTKPSSYSDYSYINSQEEDDVWGVLVPIPFKQYETSALTGEINSFGRSPDNTFMFHKENHKLKQKVFDNISKTHFIIQRKDSEVTITDKSLNGTFVNGLKVPKDQNFPLPHLSIISMAVVKNKVFQFINKAQEKLVFGLAPSEFFKKYTLEDEILGKGGYAIVRKGFVNRDYRDKIAIKIIDKDNIRDRCGNDERDFSYEVHIAKEMNHPNVIRIRDFFENDHFIYIVMDLAAGGSLFDYIRKKRGVMDEALAKNWFLQILTGVKFLHSRNIIHRDIKTENVLLHRGLDSNYNLKITDFGASRYLNPQSQCLSPVGTERYWAPEVTSGSGYTKQADIWSLGCLLYIMLVGAIPFNDQKPSQNAIAFLLNEPRLMNDSLARNLLSSFLKMEPNQRISIEEAIHHEWFHEDSTSTQREAKRQRTK